MSLRCLLLAGLITLPASSSDWSPQLAARYLDSRQKEWFAWPRAQTSTGQPCVSCHTGEPYLLARPALRRALGDTQPTAYETGLLDSLRKRATKTDPKELFRTVKEPGTSRALAVESIFAALFLATDDATHNRWSTETQQAFGRMWSMQIREGDAEGAWPWNEFD